MSAQAPQEIARLFGPEVGFAVAPLAALAAGVVLLLAAGAFALPRPARGAIVVLALAAAAALYVRQILAPDVGPILGGTFRADATTAAWGLIFVGAALFAWLFSRHYYEEDRPFQSEHDALLLATPIGMALMAGAGDLLVFFVGLELLSIPLYALAAFRRDRALSVEAGLKYFLLGAFAAAFFLYGAALIYAATGTISLAELADDAARRATLSSPLALAGVGLVVASLAFKASVFPFHLWVPDVYQGSPTPVTALMATGTKAAAFAFLLSAVDLLPVSSASAVAWIAILTMAAGNFAALVQTDVKRMLAYSGVAHAGTALLAIAGARAGDPEPGGALHALVFYMAAYLATAAGAFGLLARLERCGVPPTLEALRGLSQTRPWTAAGLTLFLLSLGGIPATGGFLGKYLVFAVAVRADMIAIAVVGVLLSVVALGYYLRVVVAMYMQPASEGAHADATTPGALPSAIAAGLCAALVLALGLLPRVFLESF
jgi:NADH-quinone oxidoreductase subunit N